MRARLLFSLFFSLVTGLQINAQKLINIDFGAHTNPNFPTKTGKAAIGNSDLDFWNLYSRDSYSPELLNLKLADGTGTDADLYVFGAPGAWYTLNSDPMFLSYLYPGNPNIQITLTNVPAAIYDVYVYAHGQPATENSIVELSAGSVSYGQKATSSAPNWDQPGWIEGNEFVVFRNVSIQSSNAVSMLIKPGVASMAVINGIQLFEVSPPDGSPIVLSQQPQTLSIPFGGNAEFAVSASSDRPLTYQWLFNGAAISNANSSALYITNSVEANAGEYSVIVQNAERSIRSTNAFLLLYKEITGSLLNIDFGAHQNEFLFQKIGAAAVGQTAGDRWNLYSRDGENGESLDNNSLPNLVWSDGTSTGARIDVSNAGGAWYTLHPDAMFHSYLYPLSRAGNINAVLSDLTAGVYDVYVYAHGQVASENAVVQLSTDSSNFGIKVTGSNSDWNEKPWKEGSHYLVFQNVHVRSGERLNISSKPGQSGLAVINGIQLHQKSTNPPTTIVIGNQPSDVLVPHGGTAEFSVTATNGATLSYQWFFNNLRLAFATNNVLRIENASSNDVGGYYVEISSATDSVISQTARLQVYTQVDGPLLNIDYGAHLNPYLPTNAGPAAVGIALDDRWNLYSRDGASGSFLNSNRLSNLVWSDGAPSSISVTVNNADGAWYTLNPNPMFKSYLYPGSRYGNISSILSNLPAGMFDFYIYAHGQIPGENGQIELSTTTGTLGQKSTSSAAGWDVPAWTEGNHYVLFKNVVIHESETVFLIAKPGLSGLAVINGVQIVRKSVVPGSEITIQHQPHDVIAPVGSAVELNVTATSGLPLEYQWYYETTAISGATSPVLRFENIEHANAGRYHVVVRNSESAIDSSSVRLDVYSAVEAPLLNVDFGAHQNPVFTTNVGPAAFGRDLEDRWNLYSRDDGQNGWVANGTLTNLVWSDGTNSSIRLEVTNAAGAWYTLHLNSMFESYLYPLSRIGNISATFSHLPAGKYDLIVYAHGQIPSENVLVQVSTDSTTFATKTNSAAADWDPGYWVDGGQFVTFSDITILPGEDLEITTLPGESGLAVINGLQLIFKHGSRDNETVPSAPVLLAQPQARSGHIGGSAHFSVTAIGSAPLSYQWMLNETNIAGATLPSLVLSNLNLADGGHYSVEVSNAAGSTNSSSVFLTILPPDDVPPTITITSPDSGESATNRITLAGSARDNQALSHVEWLRDGQFVGVLALHEGSFILTNILLNTGTNYFTVRAFDVAGNSASSSVAVVLQLQRALAVGNSSPVQEGARVSFPILVTSSGEIGALSFSLSYDTNYLSEPSLRWENHLDGAFTQVNTDLPGSVVGTYVLPGRTLSAGAAEELATVTFRTRSIPDTLATPINLVLHGVYSDAGDPITSGTAAQSGQVRITRREYIGDNNANDRLDIADGTAIIRMVTLLDPIRPWDVTGNDLNSNSSLDAGDIVRVLRAVVNLDPQPSGQNAPQLAAASASNAKISLSSSSARLTPGGQIKILVSLAELGQPLSGASFRLNYPAGALRLESSSAHSAGSLVPQNSLTMWHLLPDQDYAQQSGTIRFAASSATGWAASSGAIAELNFTVLPAAASQYAWPLRVSQAEAAAGLDPVSLGTAEILLTGRDAQPAQLAEVAFDLDADVIQLRLIGEAGVRYQVMSSTNLVDWTEVGVYSDASGAVLISDPIDPDAAQKFYRATQLD